MAIHFLFLFLPLIYLSTITTTTAKDDKTIMSTLLSSITPPPPTWNKTTGYCTWAGISCDSSLRVTSVNLQSKSIKGSLPITMNKLTQLTILSLQNNQFFGQIPSFSGLTSLTSLTLDNNNFTSVSPFAFSGLPKLQTFSISGNENLSPWSFPSELSNSTSITRIFASGVNLVGCIPDSLTRLTQLRMIDMSHNNLTGKLPAFGPGVVVNTMGNQLFGKDRLTPGVNPTSGGSDGEKGSSISFWLVVGIVIGVMVFVVAVTFALCKCYTEKKKRDVKSGKVGPEVGNGSGKTEEMRTVNEGGNVAFSVHILRQVTDNFSEDNVLGRGGFGVVYKGELHDGTKIAVKRTDSGAMGNKGLNEFQAEIGVLTKVKHRHLVALLGFCVNGNERLLVYEYMAKGHLGQHLFKWQEHNYPPLTWKQRVTIALDVARGVEYLHSLAETIFIHRDLKPSNILLGDDMRAKVADFGLVKSAPDGKSFVATRLAGTFGYLSPEYASTGRVTTKVDVFAFGVILMELITGRKALDESLPEEMSHLATWFRRVLIHKDSLIKAIDSALGPDDETYDIICRVAELAGHCTTRDPHQRPDMGHAVSVLGPIVEQWKPHQEVEDSSGAHLQMSLPQALMKWQADEGTSTDSYTL